MPRQFERDLTDSLDMGTIPGVVVGVTSGESTQYEAGFGVRSTRTFAPMTVDTVFNIASMTKPIAGAAVMQLVEKNILNLDTPASEILPYLGEVKVLVRFDEAGNVISRSPKRPLTLRHLLTHTSGFSSDWCNALLEQYISTTGHPRMSTGMKKALEVPLVFDPGEKWGYGVSMDWAGLILEEVTGVTLHEYIRAHITEPLEMFDTTYFPSDEMKSRMTSVHIPQGNRRFQANEHVIASNREYWGGGGGLYSTVSDYMKFIRMILNDGRAPHSQLFESGTIELMTRNAMGANRVEMLVSTNKSIANDAEFFPGLEKTWGLTFQINENKTPTGRSPGSLSWSGIFNTYFWIDHEKDIGGVFLSQLQPWMDVSALALFEKFEALVYQDFV